MIPSLSLHSTIQPQTRPKLRQRHRDLNKFSLASLPRRPRVRSTTEGPDLRNAQTLEVIQPADIIRSGLGDPMAIIGECEFAAHFYPFLFFRSLVHTYCVKG